MYADRLPPHDATAEESVIGSVLIDSNALAGIATFLIDTDFYGEKNRWCYEGMSELAKRGVAINQVTLAHELADKGRLEELGGSAYLSHLVMGNADQRAYRPLRPHRASMLTRPATNPNRRHARRPRLPLSTARSR